MSDRAAWLERWCPECGGSSGSRCQRWHWGRRGSAGGTVPVTCLHVTGGWLERSYPTCRAAAGERCLTPSGREVLRVHRGGLRAARWELVRRAAVWEGLERRGATSAIVSFCGRAGRGGRTEKITLLRLDGAQVVEVERWSGRDELCYALEAPVWGRFGTFAGHPLVRREVIWSGDDRRVRIQARRGDRPFEELVS